MKLARLVGLGMVGLAAVVAACAGSDAEPTPVTTNDAGTSNPRPPTTVVDDDGSVTTPVGDYVVMLTPNAVVVDPSSTVQTAFSFVPDANFSDGLDVTIDGLPKGVTATIDPTTVTVTADATAIEGTVAVATLHAVGHTTNVVHDIPLTVRVGHFLVATDTPMLWMVPADVTKIRISAWGAGGGSGGGGRNAQSAVGGVGGGGGFAQADFVVTPNESLALSVATGGSGGIIDNVAFDHGAGGGGGGFTSVFTSPSLDAGAPDLSAYLLIAGGGGGGSGAEDTTSVINGSAGGGGGGMAGNAGSSDAGADGGGPGQGGTQTAGGFSNGGTDPAAQGKSLLGANAGQLCDGGVSGTDGGTPGGGLGGPCDLGGGGGGGWYGGGGGEGGGGGSGFIATSGTNPILVAATGSAPPSTTTAHYNSDAGGGGYGILGDSGIPGSAGRIVISIPPN